MNSLLVKAVEERVKYIEEVYKYGLTCNTCKDKYLDPFANYIISKCFDEYCVEDLNQSENTTISCNINITKDEISCAILDDISIFFSEDSFISITANAFGYSTNEAWGYAPDIAWGWE